MFNLGYQNKVKFFQGWYFKNQNESNIVSFIPAFHTDDNGNRSASIQVITNTESYNISYPINEFTMSKSGLVICLGENKFSNQGIVLNIRTDKLTVEGKLRYTAFTPLRYDIMGPFKYIPFLQCRHSIFSLAHCIEGSLSFNGDRMDFHRGLGYVEGDRGVGFPSDYLWTQCSWIEHGYNSVMVSIAIVKLGILSFTGCIGVVYYCGREYRLATYLGANIRRLSKVELWVQQGKCILQVKLLEPRENNLLAPVMGKMSRTVYESVDCRVHYRFILKGNVVFDIVGRGSFERGL
ncbi:MAG TPA: hypothetical protein VJZ06_02125 [Mobilitalea sp.]|nr:hypothetical protein [Mobilitalea sp.]